MIHKRECYNDAIQSVRNSHRNAVEKADRLRKQLLQQQPELNTIEKSLISLSQKKMLASIRGDDSLFQQLQHQYNKLLQSRASFLESIGWDANAFSPKFNCTLCDDSGYTQGGYCDCVRKLAGQYMLKQLCSSMECDTMTFSDFSLDYYDDPDERQHMGQIFSECLNYAKSFSRNSESIYMLGNTGLGKTHLTFAMAREIVKNGFAVEYTSAQNMITALEKEHFGQNMFFAEQYYVSCELLIIDDLGTEYLSPVAKSALYNVINARILAKLPTIISSNLSPKQLEERYGERLVSRIFGCYRTMRFVGKDIRIQKKLASKKV